MKYIKPRLDFLNEAKANPYYQEKVKKEKDYIRKLIPSSIKITPLIYKYFLTEEYNDLCVKYLIPVLKINHTYLSVRYDDDIAKGKLDITSKNEPYMYSMNLYGSSRFLSNLNLHNYTEQTLEERKGIIESAIALVCNPIFYFRLDVYKHQCVCDIDYSFNYYDSKKVEVKVRMDKVIKNITKNDVIEFIIQCLKESYSRLPLSSEFDNILQEIKPKLVDNIKKEIIRSNYDMKLVGALEKYPDILPILDLDMDRVSAAKSMGELGF